jgi:hypothetical protein
MYGYYIATGFRGRAIIVPDGRYLTRGLIGPIAGLF